MKIRNKIIFMSAFLCLGVPGKAERIYSFSTLFDAVGALDDNPRVSGFGTQRTADEYVLNYGFYPSLTFGSEGARSNLELTYAFGLNRIDTDLDLDSESHSVDGAWNFQATRKLAVSFSDSFTKSPDFTSFNLFRGIVFTPEGAFLDYETVALQRDSFANTARLNFDYQYSPRSSFAFGVGHSLRDFENSDSFLRDQQRFTGHFQYTRALTPHTRWTLGYNLFQYEFEGAFQDGRNHDVAFGISHQATPTVSLNLSGGPSYAEFPGAEDNQSGFLGYNASFMVHKEFERERISLAYRRRNTAAIGIGGLVKTNSVSFNFDRSLGSRAGINAGLTFLDTDRTLSQPQIEQSLQGSLIWRFMLTDNWSINAGASYQTQEGLDAFDLERRRFFVSLRFALPDFWRFRK